MLLFFSHEHTILDWSAAEFSSIKTRMCLQGDPERGEVPRVPPRGRPLGHQQKEEAHQGQDAWDSCEWVQQQVFLELNNKSQHCNKNNQFMSLNFFSSNSSDEDDRLSLFGYTEVDRQADEVDKPAESRIRSLWVFSFQPRSRFNVTRLQNCRNCLTNTNLLPQL